MSTTVLRTEGGGVAGGITGALAVVPRWGLNFREKLKKVFGFPPCFERFLHFLSFKTTPRRRTRRHRTDLEKLRRKHPSFVAPPEETNMGPGFNRGSGGGARGFGFEERVGAHARSGVGPFHIAALSVCVCVCLSAAAKVAVGHSRKV